MATGASRAAAPLPDVPIIETGPAFPLETLAAAADRANALLDTASHRYPKSALKALDAVSRAWLARWNNAHLPEIDAIAKTLGRPGAYFFSVNYEWGCTCRAAPSPDGRSARLMRVLDWRTPGLGANIVCAKVTGAPAGPFALITWPGYSGVLQVMAPGRFSASLNQAPMRKSSGLFYLDWAANRRRVWRMPYPTPAHLLRHVVETATSFAEARRMLADSPIATPGIFTLAGLEPRETAVIERTEREARIRDGDHVAANHWQSAGWHGRPRGEKSPERACMMAEMPIVFDPEFPCLQTPILNDFTRIAMVADAKEGRMIARGYEALAPATATLDLTWAP
ncbi:hypothetical protein DLM45_09880 [Hyphomicrobium methylovorum]|uniref:hypothetical protein n=1 Tax=Hyphomicrobium methylovorum TaxID=84 RepID=UPI0015E67130|nr:hypothetical protein [Hyphomicrobium methylovorum]MBA2126527.1 hypothetical protein [Hyphomicrobium methylovorum]